ncbi:MAG: GspH/FimT family pseudopilin [Desulfatiglandales bacterium]
MISGKLRNRKGWTLIELMIAIALIGIISAFAIPGYLAGMPLRRLKADAMDITSNMKYAKMKAVQRNINVGVYFNSGGSAVNGVDPDAYCVYEDSGSTPNVFDSTDNRLKPNIKLKTGVKFDTVNWTINDDNAGNNTVIFKTNGSAIFGPVTTGNNSGTVVIKNGSLTRSIVLTKITGRIQIP